MQIESRTLYRVGFAVVSALIAVFAGALVAGILGHNIWFTIYSILEGALGSTFALENTLDLGAVLLLTGLAAAIAFTGGIWNFGMEGQLYVGALASMVPIFLFPPLGPLTVPMALIFGALGGAGYAALAGALKTELNVNIVVSTMLLNFVSPLVVDYVTQPGGPLHDATSFAFNRSPQVPLAFQIQPVAGTALEPTFAFALILAVLILLLIKRTRLGFELRIMGGNYRAAEYVGVKVWRNLMAVISISGGLSGMAGCILVLTLSHALFNGMSSFYGWLGIPVALLASLNPIAAIFSAFFFAILNTGSITMQSMAGVPSELALMIEAIIVIVMLVQPSLEGAVSSRVS